jgi:hypothetical protein
MTCTDPEETRLLLSDNSLEDQMSTNAKATPLPLVQLGGMYALWVHTTSMLETFDSD